MENVNPVVAAVAAVTSEPVENSIVLTDAVENAPALVESGTEAPVKVEDAPPLPKKELTEKDWRAIRRLYVTVRLNTVEPCGHKLDPSRDPRGNCPYCWFVFFQTHGELVQTADEMFQKVGSQGLETLRGKKFVKNFLRFMAVIATMKAQAEAQKEKNGEISSTGEPGSSSGPAESSSTSTGDSGIEQGAIIDGGQVQGAGTSQEGTGQAV